MTQVTDRYAFELDTDVRRELDSHQVSIEDEILHKQPGLHAEPVLGGPEGEKDVVTIIAATSSLAPLVVPIVLELIRRFRPRVDYEEATERWPDGTTLHRIRIRES
jgi:hypothetical protein